MSSYRALKCLQTVSYQRRFTHGSRFCRKGGVQFLFVQVLCSLSGFLWPVAGPVA